MPQKKSGGWVGSTRKEQLPADWPSLRKEVFARDGKICHICGGDGADRVDHIVPGNNHAPENLAPVHDFAPPHCHRKKSSKEGHAAMARIRALGKMPIEQHPGFRSA